MLVFFHHSEHIFRSAWLSPLASFGHDSVVFFFLLSGFVIAHTTQNKDRSLRDYAVARLARIYSVALPSLLLVLALYVAGTTLHADGYRPLGVDEWAKLLSSSALFLNQSLDPRLAVPTNAAYWSVCFEVWYYVFFGCMFYLRGPWRIGLTVLAMLLAGLPILLMFPIWGMGYWFYRQHTRWRMGTGAAALIALTALALYFGMRGFNLDDHAYNTYAAWWGGDAELNARLGFGKHFLIDYVTATLFLLLLVGLLSLGELLLPLLTRLRRPIDFAAGGSFSLYLFHMPLLAFLAPLVRSSFATMGLTLAIIYALAALTERRKAPYVQLFRRLLPK